MIIKKVTLWKFAIGFLMASYVGVLLQTNLSYAMRPVITSLSTVFFMWAILFKRPNQTHILFTSLSYIFLLYSSISLLFIDEIIYGIQNIMVFGCFFWSIKFILDRPNIADSGLQIIFLTTSISVAFFLILSFLLYGLNSSILIANRPLALFASLLTAWTAGKWLFEKKTIYLIVTVLLGIGILTTVSRAATGVYFLVLLLTFSSSLKGLIKSGVLVTLTLICILFFSDSGILSAFKQRSGQGEMVHFGQLSINATGRREVWMDVVSNWTKTPSSILFGNGAGSSGYLISRYYATNAAHNEYLRAIHDYGLVGFSVWLLLHIILLITLWKRSLLTSIDDNTEMLIIGRNVYTVHLIAALAVNTMIYSFTMVAVGLLVGMALIPRHTQK